MARAYCQWVLSGFIAVLLAGMTALTAVAKCENFYTPLTIRIVGSNGDRTFEVVGGGEGEDACAFAGQVGSSMALGSGDPAGLPAPGLTDFYEVVITQGSTAEHRVPWYGMPTAQFFYYPARGTIPTYVRLHLGRVSEPARDAWLVANLSLTNLVERHLDGLEPFRPPIQHSPRIPAWVWLGLAPSLVVGILILLRLERTKEEATGFLRAIGDSHQLR